jgi:hypothetical protein
MGHLLANLSRSICTDPMTVVATHHGTQAAQDEQLAYHHHRSKELSLRLNVKAGDRPLAIEARRHRERASTWVAHPVHARRARPPR